MGHIGYIESEEDTQWIPGGISVWKLGAGTEPESEAEEGYAGLLGDMTPEERSQRGLVCVTSRHWRGKDAWSEGKRQLGDWRDVRAYDGGDLEEWVEQSVPVQVWLAERLGTPVDGFRTLERSWEDWSGSTEPALPRALFDVAVEAHAGQFENMLGRIPSSMRAGIFLQGDSPDESLAFLSCLIEDEKFRNEAWVNQTVVIDSPESVKKLRDTSPENLVAVTTSRDVERALDPRWSGWNHYIFACPRGLYDSNPVITLDRIDPDTFRNALGEVAIEAEEAERLYRRSAGSPTVLRQILRREARTRKLPGMALAGRWRANHDPDREAVRTLARTADYGSVEWEIESLLGSQDPPVWSLTKNPDPYWYRGGATFQDSGEETEIRLCGVVSSLDCLTAVGEHVSEARLDDFFALAGNMLSAGYSPELRAGLCETLAILAVHGGNILNRPEMDLEEKADLLVVGLLGSSDPVVFESLDSELPDLAEAAPETFLDQLENRLRPEGHDALTLYSKESGPTFDPGSHSGLLRALERLAWAPEHLPRVADILGELSDPTGIFRNIFNMAAPQTSAGAGLRNEILRSLAGRYPETVGSLLRQLIWHMSDDTHFTYLNERPCWRPYTFGAGEDVTRSEREQGGGPTTERLDALCELIDEWAGGAPESAKTDVWNSMRMEFGDGARSTTRARETIARLAPADPELRHGWMFKTYWKSFLAARADEGADPDELERRIEGLRLDALREIWESRGLEGLGALIEGDKYSARCAGELIPRVIGQSERMALFVRDCVGRSLGEYASDFAVCLSAALRGADHARIQQFAEDIQRTIGREGLLILLVSAPLTSATLRILDTTPEQFQTEFWQKTDPQPVDLDVSEVNRIVARLMDTNRHVDALKAVEDRLEAVETARLMRLLDAVAVAGSENSYAFTRDHLEPALGELNSRPGVSTQEKADLELRFVGELRPSGYGIPNLELLIADSPLTFAELIKMAYGKTDKQENGPSGFKDHLMSRGAAAMVLDILHRVPGARADGSVDGERLRAWMKEVFTQFGGREREDQLMAMQVEMKIGELLSGAPADPDGVWPCRAVCEAIEWQWNEWSTFSRFQEFEGGAVRRMEDFANGPQPIAGFKIDQKHELGRMCCHNARKIASQFPHVAEELREIAERYEYD